MGGIAMIGLLIGLGGLSGAFGIALSAIAAHYPGAGNLTTAAEFLLLHGPAFFALAVLAGTNALPRWVLVLGSLALVSGLSLFAGDLASRTFFEARLFHWAAPLGGSLMMIGWLWFALAGFFSMIGGQKAAKID
jgi:uncharacterized membrane protein YgdD (TMEM256/DUF423 family)